MARQVRQRTILDVTVNTIGDVYRLSSKQQHLFVITITGVATVAVQGRQKNGSWREFGSVIANNEINLDDYGWYEIRAVSTGMVGGTANVVWSWR